MEPSSNARSVEFLKVHRDTITYRVVFRGEEGNPTFEPSCYKKKTKKLEPSLILSQKYPAALKY